MRIKNLRILNVGENKKVLPAYLEHASRNRTDAEIEICFGPFRDVDKKDGFQRRQTYEKRRNR